MSFLTPSPSPVDDSETIFLGKNSSLLSWRLLINAWSNLTKHSKLGSLKRLLEEVCAALNSTNNEHDHDLTSSLLRKLISQSSLQWLDIASLDPDCAKAVLKFASEHVGNDTKDDLCSLLFYHLLGYNNIHGRMKSDSSLKKKTTTTTTMKVTTRPTLAPGTRQVFDVLTRLCYGSRNCFLFILEHVEEISNFVKDIVCGGHGGVKMCSKNTIASAMALLSTLYKYTLHPRHLRRSKVVSTERMIKGEEEEEMGGRGKHMHHSKGFEHEHESNSHNQNDLFKVHDDNDGDNHHHHHHQGHDKLEDASILHNSNTEEKKEEEEYGDDAEFIEDDELSNKEDDEEESPVNDDVGVDDELLKAEEEEEEEEKVTPHSPVYQMKPSVAFPSSPPSPFSPSSPSSSLITLERDAVISASPSPQLTHTTYDKEKVASLYHNDNERTSMKGGTLFLDPLNSHNDSQSSLSFGHHHQNELSTFSNNLANEVSLLWRLAVPLMSERELKRTIDEVSEYWKTAIAADITATTHFYGSVVDVDDDNNNPVADKNEVQTMKEEEEIQGPDRKEVVEEEEEEELVSPDLSYLGGTAGDYGQSYGGEEEYVEEEEYAEEV